MKIEKLMDDVQFLCTDFVKYMDTTVPKGANRTLFTHLKYSNRQKLQELECEEGLNHDLVEKIAVHELLKQDKQTILKLYNAFMENTHKVGLIRYEDNKGNE